MKHSFILASSVAVASLLGSAAIAQEYKGRLSGGVSTLGATLEASYRIHEKVAVRGKVAGLVNISPTITFDGTDYDTSVGPEGYGAMIDFYPLERYGLRMSAGVMYAQINASGSTTATAANPVTVGGQLLNSGEVITASAEFKNAVQPILSIGWDQPLGDSPFVLSAEIGATYTGGIDPAVSATGGIIPTLANFGVDVQSEVDAIAADLPDIPVYPFASVMIGIRF